MTSRPPAGRYRAVIFDLDRVLLARERAWRYTVEEAVLALTGRRVDTAHLAAEYSLRPWQHVLSLLLDDDRARRDCEELCAELYARSSMKRLLVHEGIGMALDHLRAARIELGALSREPHGIALKQVQSTGLDRFLAVLSATPDARWDVGARLREALAFLEYEPAQCAYVAAETFDARAAAALGFAPYIAAWVVPECDLAAPAIDSPSELTLLVAP